MHSIVMLIPPSLLLFHRIFLSALNVKRGFLNHKIGIVHLVETVQCFGLIELMPALSRMLLSI